MPADCTAAPVTEPIQVGEAPKPPAGWPEAVADHAAAVQRRAAHIIARRERIREPIPRTSYAPLRDAIKHAQERYDIYQTAALAQTLCEEFGRDLERAAAERRKAVPLPAELVKPLTDPFQVVMETTFDSGKVETHAIARHEFVHLHDPASMASYFERHPDEEGKRRANAAMLGWYHAQQAAARSDPAFDEYDRRSSQLLHEEGLAEADLERALKAILAVEAISIETAMLKVRAFLAFRTAHVTRTGRITSNGGLDTEEVFASLWRDLRALSHPKVNGIASSLLSRAVEHNRQFDALNAANEVSDEASDIWYDEIKDLQKVIYDAPIGSVADIQAKLICIRAALEADTEVNALSQVVEQITDFLSGETLKAQGA